MKDITKRLKESKKKLNAYSDNWHEKFVDFIKDRAKKNKKDVLIGSIPYKKKNLKFHYLTMFL